MRSLLLASAALLFSCSNGRGSCHFNSDCPSGSLCSGGHCVAGHDAGGTVDSGTTPSDAGHDAATVTMDDAGHDAAVIAPDAGHDAAVVLADAGHDAAVIAHDAGHTTSSAPLIFSEYIEGSANNKALEIANLGTTTFDLTGCVIEEYANGSATASTTMLTGSIPAGGVTTLCNSGATGFSPSSCTVSNASASVSFNGNDAVALVCGGGTVDVIGQIGVDPGAAGWGTTVTTTNQTLRRMCSVTTGDSNGSDAFDPALEWTSAGMDVFDGLGSRGCP